MYKAKLSFGQLCEYVPMLLEQGLLENLTVVKHRQFKHVLKTTEKGQKFLESLRSLELLWLP
jgi:predicted transcriptional regulator